jgi:hypothetical protein
MQAKGQSFKLALPFFEGKISVFDSIFYYEVKKNA